MITILNDFMTESPPRNALMAGLDIPSVRRNALMGALTGPVRCNPLMAGLDEQHTRDALVAAVTASPKPVLRPEVYPDEQGFWRWRLRHWNGNIISVSSEGYVQREDAVHGLQLTSDWHH